MLNQDFPHIVHFRKFRLAKKRSKIAVVVASLSILMGSLIVGPPAVADETGESPTVEFGVLETANYVDVYNAIVLINGSDTASEFFSEAVAQSDLVDLPGLEVLSHNEQVEVLEASAEAAEHHAPLPLGELPPEISGNEDVSDATATTAVWSGKATFGTAVAKTNLPPTTSRASFSSAPVAGGPTNNNFSWQMKNRYEWTECSILRCEITSWLDFRFTTDPGKSSSRTSFNFNKWGTKIGKVQVNSWVFAAGTNYGSSGWQTWDAPSSGAQYNFHNSTLNKSFQAWYEVKIGIPGGTQPFEFKTGKTATCKEPARAGYACLF